MPGTRQEARRRGGERGCRSVPRADSRPRGRRISSSNLPGELDSWAAVRPWEVGLPFPLRPGPWLPLLPLLPLPLPLVLQLHSEPRVQPTEEGKALGRQRLQVEEARVLGWRGPRGRHLLGEVAMEHFHPDHPDQEEEEEEVEEEEVEEEELVLVLVAAGDLQEQQE
jgi:hypothetical protein